VGKLEVKFKGRSGDRRWICTQFGFTPQRSTSHHLFYLLDRIYYAFSKRSTLPACFLDIRKAFDSVSHIHLLYLLTSSCHISGKLLATIRLLLTSRYFCVVDRGLSSKFYPASAGVPQGSVLSPILFLAFINAACASFPLLYRTIPLLFADDLSLIPLDHNEAGLNCLQSSLDAFNSWCESFGLAVNMKKSNLVAFTRTKFDISACPSFPLHIKREILPLAPSYTYLGIPLSSSLSSKQLSCSLITSASNRSALVTRLISFSSAPNFTTVLQFTKAFVQSSFSYYLPFIRLPISALRHLSSILIRPIRRFLQLPFTTSTHAILAECGLLPTIWRRIFLFLSTFRSYAALPLHTPHRILNDQLISFPQDKNYDFRPRSSFIADEALLYCSLLHIPFESLLPDSDLTLSNEELFSAVFNHSVTPNLSNYRFLDWKYKHYRSSYLSLLPRPLASFVARLRLNRLYLPFGPRLPYCPFCFSLHCSLDHLLLKCPEFASSRSSLRSTLTALHLPLSLPLILFNFHSVPPKKHKSVLRACSSFLTSIQPKISLFFFSWDL